MNVSSAQFNLTRRGSTSEPTGLDAPTSAYQEEVAKACGITLDKRILAFKSEPPPNEKEDLRQTYCQTPNHLRPGGGAGAGGAGAHSKRRILTTPERILDAPGLLDDYYLNLLDWSSSNLLAIGLDKTVYIWNAESGDVTTLCQLEGPDDYIASLQWTADSSYLAVGLSDGDVQIWDPDTQQKMRSMVGHQARVGALAWDSHILSSGCRDGSIWHHDVRVATHKVAELLGHTSEVCGLAWRADSATGTSGSGSSGIPLLASGGNDNLVNLWDARSSHVPKFTKANHTAAVKAVAWCPWQPNLLATGGGAHDRHIHFWNTTTAARLHSIDTGSQVTSIRWSLEYRELVSSHGFPDHQLSVWSYPALTKMTDIPAHDTRVLHTALSPDGQTLATVSSDDNLKFWRVFEAKPKSIKSGTDGDRPGRTNSLESRAMKLR
ncbi:WD40-repeat-containing domain protein [Dimargaris cristalligena]|uniref:WD40-repeat-containing domain protein n=1 Tax=Dimargaris cristalligena TaxID=215637 RepID=A0A4P9ZVD5_9FUNG|nr:WD40-repeat-containing domain protein [Dimargaris cristalligena]|eukprot:RKP37547.1 WD40-repeat-containing domain protein [Dimargaris cristalligena]